MPKRWWLAAGAVALLVATPASRSLWKSTLFLLQVLPSDFKPLVSITRSPEVSTESLAHGSADVYVPRARGPAVVLVHGANPGGNKDPRVSGMADAFARLGRTVVVPSLALGRMELDTNDLDLIKESVEFAHSLTGDEVVIVSFSFGAAFALVALAEDASAQSKVQLFASTGTYYDLVHLLQGVTTGSVPGGTSPAEWNPAKGAGEAVTGFLAGYLPEAERAQLVGAYEDRRPEGLSAEARTIYDLMTNEDPTRTRELAAALPGELPGLIERLSPATHAEDIEVPVIAMHSTNDPAAPPSESHLLAEAVGGEVHVLESFRHVTPTGGWRHRINDARELVTFSYRVFRTQEPWVPGT